jgi:hypothetical protein
MVDAQAASASASAERKSLKDVEREEMAASVAMAKKVSVFTYTRTLAALSRHLCAPYPANSKIACKESLAR